MTSWAADKKTVLCIGNNVIDFVSITKKYPTEDRDNRSYNGYWQRGGYSSNNCTVLKKLGAEVEFFGVLSRSETFRMLLEDMAKMNIKFSNCPRTDLEPPFCLVSLVKDTKSTTVVHCNRGYPYVTLDDFKKLDLDDYGWIHFEAKSHKDTILMVRHVLDYNSGREKKIRLSLNFSESFNEVLPICNMVHYVFLHKSFAVAQGWDSAESACFNLFEKLQLRVSIDVNRPHIICDWDEGGIGILENNSIYQHVDAVKPKNIVDTLGMNDALIGAFIFAKYIRERKIKSAAEFAAAAASTSCECRGLTKINAVLETYAW